MKMRLSSASYIVFLVMLFVFSADMTASVLPRVGEGDSLVRKSIYPPSATRKSDLYNKLGRALPHTLFSPYYRSRRYLAIAVGRGEGG